MARKSSTKTTENPTEQIMNAIDAPINLEWSSTAEKLNISVPQLQERISAKLNDSTVFSWDNLPVEHEPLVEQIARDLESEASVRRLTPEPEEIPQLSQIEPPILEEGIKPAKRRGRPKKESTALTQKKVEEIQETRQESTQVTDGIAETLIEFNALEGLQDSSNAATAYLAAFETNLANQKGEGAATIAAQILTRTAHKQNFSPNELLNRLGVPLSPETRANLNEVMSEMTEVAKGATEEMMDTAWGNGFSPKDALTRLKQLRNLNN